MNTFLRLVTGTPASTVQAPILLVACIIAGLVSVCVAASFVRKTVGVKIILAAAVLFIAAPMAGLVALFLITTL
jgi:multisubunit Na+/H+ antiporter MnhG subunit